MTRLTANFSTVQMKEKGTGAPVWGSPVSKNFFMRQTINIAQKYDELNWIADGPKERKNLFAPEIDRIKAKDGATAEKLAAVCDAVINFLKFEEIGFMMFRESMKLSVLVVCGSSGSSSALVNSHVEMRDDNRVKAWESKKQMESHKSFILALKAKPEYANNELLDYLLMVIDKKPQFIGKPPA